MRIPSVHELKKVLEKKFPDVPFSFFTEPARRVAQILREKRQKGEAFDEREIEKLLEESFKSYIRPSLRRVINGTGVVIHTNLGRSPLADEAIEEILSVALCYSNLEFNLEEGKRGSRYSHVEGILKELTGAEGALVVNNNASAVLIALNTIAKGKEVIVSRGELVEIGGSFRIPEVMAWSGAILKEVGTTNKTHLRDYENAINENTGLLLKVHKSNYAIIGFTKEVPIAELVALGRKHGLPVMEDMGSGCFVDFSKYGIKKEPIVQEILKAGVDLVTFSGDKLLGGPQAGILLGKKEIIERIRKNPLNRAIRIDKLTLAGLEATLRLYRDEKVAVSRIPVLRMILQKEEELKRKAGRLLRRIKRKKLEKVSCKVVRTFSQPGGGSCPDVFLPSYAISLEVSGLSPEFIQRFFRSQEVPVIGRIEEEKFLIDVRCLFEEDFSEISRSIQKLDEFVKKGQIK